MGDRGILFDMGARCCDRRWWYLALLLLGSLGLPPTARAEPWLAELGTCLPRHCMLDAPMRPRPDPSRSHLSHSLLDRHKLVISGMWLPTLSRTQLTSMRALRLRAPALLKSKILTSPRVTRQSAPIDPGVRGSWQLGHGKELSVALTPTPKHCAPLVEMRF